MRRKFALIFRLNPLLMLLIFCGCNDKAHQEFVSWRDGTNLRYSVEMSYGRGKAVVFPDVRFIQTNSQFIIGRGYMRYFAVSQPKDGPLQSEFMKTPDGGHFTNEVWFALDAHKRFPKCYLLQTTDEELWMKWCASHQIATNLVDINKFASMLPENKVD